MNTAADTQSLGNAIEMMDAMTQECADDIIALARLALVAFNQKDWRNEASIQQALRMILHRADDFKNSVNVQAEDAGFAHKRGGAGMRLM